MAGEKPAATRSSCGSVKYAGYLLDPKTVLPGSVSTMDMLRGSYLALAQRVEGAFGTGTWDHSGLFAGTIVTSRTHIVIDVFSAEYTRGKWLLAAEYKRRDETKGEIYTPAIAALGLPSTNRFANHLEQYYAMATYQATDRVGLGVYYSHENTMRKGGSGASDPLTKTKDWAAAVSYAVAPNWILKLEGHLIDGRSLVFSAGDDNRHSGTDATWTYFVAKTTFSF